MMLMLLMNGSSSLEQIVIRILHNDSYQKAEFPHKQVALVRRVLGVWLGEKGGMLVIVYIEERPRFEAGPPICVAYLF